MRCHNAQHSPIATMNNRELMLMRRATALV